MKPNKDLLLIRAAWFSFGSEHDKILTKMRFQKTCKSSWGGCSSSPFLLSYCALCLPVAHPTWGTAWLCKGVGKGSGRLFARSPCFSWGRGQWRPQAVSTSCPKSFLKACIWVYVVNHMEIPFQPHRILHSVRHRCCWARQTEYSCSRLHVGDTKGTSMCIGRRGTQLPWKQTGLPWCSRWWWWGYRGLVVAMVGSWDDYLSFCLETTAPMKLRETGHGCLRSAGCLTLSKYKRSSSIVFTYLNNFILFTFLCDISFNI